jgi:formyl-CoA transferase
MLQPVAQSDGSVVPITGPAAKFARTPVAVRSGARALGADDDAILGEAGLDDAAIAALRRDGVI